MNTTPARWNVYMPLLFAVVMIIGMQLGFKLYENLKGKPTMSAFKGGNLSELQEILSLVDNRYVDTINNNQLLEHVIEQTLQDLDPHSAYITPDELQEVNESLEGNFVGIGIEFALVNDTVVVVTPISGGPSEKLGIMAGDKIIEINDSLVAGVGITNKTVMNSLRGERGTEVAVSILRPGVKELIDYTIVRDDIPIVSVDAAFMMDNQVGYIKINRFSANTYNEFMDNLLKLKEQGMTKLMIDLRQNPGGYLNAAVSIADELIDGSKLLVYTQGRTYERKDYTATGRRIGNFEIGDLVLLIDEGSASASEILAGAIQDWDRGTLIGRRTFGKGLVQEQYNLSNGGALRLTVARYYTPTGRSIQKPYNDGYDAYEEELNQRLEDGELLGNDSIHGKKQRTDTIAFKTLVKGRTVYGGGGISPDVFVPLDTTGLENFTIKVRSLLPEFVYNYYSNNKQEFANIIALKTFKQNYTISNAMYAQFNALVKKKIGFVDEKLMKQNEQELKSYMKAYIAKQIWNYEGFYTVTQEVDKTLQEAYKQITNPLSAESKPTTNKQ
ncbi:S41 family peptidase [Sphingobacteriales bacterium UPWRP_1]|nr:hypothetical protein B6N25_03700 [Sphingobacteriales bacterium TSM_CSS]PSJ76627.1 S41 family peptidase [Sphingobacteriales bacterium UPWRP_1]